MYLRTKQSKQVREAKREDTKPFNFISVELNTISHLFLVLCYGFSFDLQYTAKQTNNNKNNDRKMEWCVEINMK